MEENNYNNENNNQEQGNNGQLNNESQLETSGRPETGYNQQGNGQPGNSYQQNGYQNNVQQPPQPDRYNRNKPKKRNVWLPVLAIALAILFLFGSIFTFVMRMFQNPLIRGGFGGKQSDDSLNFSSPYIAELSVNGTIQGDTPDTIYGGGQTYHHSWTVSKIKELKSDMNNRGLIMFVNTPGGGVYESDELYLAIKDYKESTGRPVYAYMASEAASGGYYISAPCDKIYANRNCWTGSIGVTIGTLYDITGLLKKYGVKTVSIHAGKNKAMGSYTEELTEEQQEILQSLVDEAYDQFVGIVAEGRKMKVDEVKKLADGRIYTAKQAKENGLIDEIGTFDDAVNEMKKKFELEGCTVQDIKYPESNNFLRDLINSAAQTGKSDAEGEIDALKALMDENGKFSVTYLAAIDR